MLNDRGDKEITMSVDDVCGWLDDGSETRRNALFVEHEGLDTVILVDKRIFSRFCEDCDIAHGKGSKIVVNLFSVWKFWVRTSTTPTWAESMPDLEAEWYVSSLATRSASEIITRDHVSTFKGTNLIN